MGQAGGADPRAEAALTVGRIVRTAIEMTDADGLGALSMRRIAATLGVGAMSLYRYVPNKDVLVDLMVDEAYREDIAAAETVTGGWRERLEAFARQEWALYLRHPWMLQRVLDGLAVLIDERTRT